MKLLTLIGAIAIAPIALGDPDHKSSPDQPEHPSDHPEHPSDHPEHPSDHPEHPDSDEDAASSDAANEAIALLKKVHEAYKSAKAISETVTLTMPAMMPGEEPETMTLTTVLSETCGKIIAKEQMTAVWVNGKFYLTLAEFDEAYIESDATSLSNGLTKATGGESMPGLWTLSLRNSDKESDWLNAFSMGMPGTKVVGVTEEDGAAIIDLKTMMGIVRITVADNNTISQVVMSIEQPGMPVMELKAVSEIAFVDSIPAVSFDSGDRKKYDSLEAIFIEMDGGGDDEQASALDGKTAPDFTLETLGGERVTLSALQGEVIVLDFWATWCGPCKRGMPFLNEFDEWAQGEGLKVKVFAVNVWEKGGAADVKKKISKFWSDKAYKTTVLMGSGDDKLTESYGISGIPTTVIVGTDGKVIETHIGFSPDMVDTLKKAVTSALAG